MNSWKTSSAGIGSILASLGLAIKGYNVGDMNLLGTGIVGVISGAGLLFARDNDKSSEQVGVK